MYRHIRLLVILIVFGLGSGLARGYYCLDGNCDTDGETCVESESQGWVPGPDKATSIKEWPRGVPNYAQSDFTGKDGDTDIYNVEQVERGDCTPVAGAMLLGYWDANGYPCLIRKDAPGSDNAAWAAYSWKPSGTPYVDHPINTNEKTVEKNSSIRVLVNALKSTMGYSVEDQTTHGTAFYDGDEIIEAASQFDPATGIWTSDADETVLQSDIIDPIKAGRPIMFQLHKTYDWELEFEGKRHKGGHSMVAFGYKEKEVGIYGDWVEWCKTSLYRDWLYVYLRTGWKRGSDDYDIWFWREAADIGVVDVIVEGGSSCVEWQDEDSDGYFSEPEDTLPGYTVTNEGIDCNDYDDSVNPGATEQCNGIDNDCDGHIDFQKFADYSVCDDDHDGINNQLQSAVCTGGNRNACNDNCPSNPNPLQEDADGDGIGDVCDDDIDGDGIPEDQYDSECYVIDGQEFCADTCFGPNSGSCNDNCPSNPNPLQEDADGDGIGDVCDACDSYGPFEDPDNDCFPNATDNCPLDFQEWQNDTDGDGFGDVCDVCPEDYNPRSQGHFVTKSFGCGTYELPADCWAWMMQGIRNCTDLEASKEYREIFETGNLGYYKLERILGKDTTLKIKKELPKELLNKKEEYLTSIKERAKETIKYEQQEVLHTEKEERKENITPRSVNPK